jgi:tripartite-type tricarboxylate transporter receptor subunit TctC
MTTIARVLAIAATLLAATPCYAQAAAPGYPSRQVRVVVPFPPGGITDMIARVLAQKLSERLGQQFYVENQPGGAGNIGTGQVANSPPDGHTLLVVSSTLTVNPALFAKLPFDTLTDLAPVTLAARTDQGLIVHPSVAAHSVKELIELVKANPRKFSYGSPGTGSTGHLAGEMFRMATGVDMVHVPFQGGGQLLSSLIGGHTPVVFTAMPLVAPAAREGKLRALALTSAKRSAAFPDVPTMTEAGVPDQISDVVQGVLVRGGTPRPIIDTLHREIALILAEQDVKQRLAAAGFEPAGTTPQQFATYIRTEIDKWATVIRAANIKPH